MASKGYHHVGSGSRGLLMLGLVVCFLLSVPFLFVGTAHLFSPSWDTRAGGAVFALAGAALFVLFFRAAWMTIGGREFYLFEMNEDQVKWGRIGKEKTFPVSEISSIHWDETEGFNLSFITKAGNRVRILCIETSVPDRCRPDLLHYLRSAHPEITLEGFIRDETGVARRMGLRYQPRAESIPMPHVLIIHEVADYPAWKKIFDAAAGIRREAGERSFQVLRFETEPDRIVHFSEWTSIPDAKAFFESPRLAKIREEAGVKAPEFHYLEQIEAGAL